MKTKSIVGVLALCVGIILSCEKENEDVNISENKSTDTTQNGDTNNGNNGGANITIETGEVYDVDGNLYATVKIGDQWWMSENLKTTKYNDETPIPNPIYVGGNSSSIGSYSWYFDHESGNELKVDTFGLLYNWHAVGTDKLCPSGWHVPSDDEWTQMEVYLAENGYNYDGSSYESSSMTLLKRTKIAKSLAAKSLWKSSTKKGAIGNDLSLNNTSGFNALPGGVCNTPYGSFGSIGAAGSWWTSTNHEDDNTWSYRRQLYFTDSNISKSYVRNGTGLSVRCVKD